MRLLKVNQVLLLAASEHLQLCLKLRAVAAEPFNDFL